MQYHIRNLAASCLCSCSQVAEGRWRNHVFQNKFTLSHWSGTSWALSLCPWGTSQAPSQPVSACTTSLHRLTYRGHSKNYRTPSACPPTGDQPAALAPCFPLPQSQSPPTAPWPVPKSLLLLWVPLLAHTPILPFSHAPVVFLLFPLRRVRKWVRVEKQVLASLLRLHRGGPYDAVSRSQTHKAHFPRSPQVIKGHLPTVHQSSELSWLLCDVLAAPGTLGSPRHWAPRFPAPPPPVLNCYLQSQWWHPPPLVVHIPLISWQWPFLTAQSTLKLRMSLLAPGCNTIQKALCLFVTLFFWFHLLLFFLSSLNNWTKCLWPCPDLSSFSPTYMHALSPFSHVRLFETSWTVTHQASLSVGVSRQEYWSGLPFSSPGDLPDPEIEPVSLTFPALADGFFTTSATWEAPS